MTSGLSKRVLDFKLRMRLAKTGLARAAPLLDRLLRPIKRVALLREAPFHPLHRNEGHRPFFIVGAARSGTTLLRRILTARNGVHIPPELDAMGRVIRGYLLDSRLPWPQVVDGVLRRIERTREIEEFGVSIEPLREKLSVVPPVERSLAFILDRFYRYHGERIGRKVRIWGDKTPSSSLRMHLIRAVFPKARFVHILRDGVDVVYSMLRAGLYSEPFEAALAWLSCVRAVEEFVGRYGRQCYEVRYGRLVQEPERELKPLCRFLDIPYDASMLDRMDHVDRMKDIRDYGHHRSVLRPVFSTSVGKGRRELPLEQKRLLEDLIGDDLERLGYGRPV